MVDLRWGAATNPGRVRTENEDTFVAEPLVFAVADGMGGHQAGEVASALAASVIRDRLGAGAASEDAAVTAVSEANAAIHGAARANAAQTGMGTTLTALAVLAEQPTPDQHDRFVLLNVGDSRTYRFRQGLLQRVTVDHSYVQELVATGHITIEEARTHPRRNIVTRALGIEPAVRADMWTLPIVRGDRFVLCSDGLVDEVPDSEILELVESVDDPQQLAEQLVDLANRNGGRDNVTVVVVDVLDGADPPDPTDEISVDPTWAETAVGAGTLELVDDPFDDRVDSEPITVADIAAVPTMPPPATPLPPAVAMMNVDDVEAAPQTTEPDSTDTTDTNTIETETETDTPAIDVTATDQPETMTPTLPTLPPVAAKATTAVTIRGDAVTDDEPVAVAAAPRRKRRFTFGVFLFVFAIAAIITVTFTFIAVHARSGYFVGFDGDTVVVFKGQSDNVLWFEPTIEARTVNNRQDLEPHLVAEIDKKPRFDSFEAATDFIHTTVIPTTSTTAPESTTSTSSPPVESVPGGTTITGP